MPLTAAQSATLKADIVANTNVIPTGYPWSGSFVGQQVKNIPNDSGDGNAAVAGWYNLLASPDYYGYRRNISSTDVFNKIDFAKLTPADAPDGTQTWANRSLCCQGKQFNLQLILDRAVIDATQAQTRATLQDALTNIPSGASGATISAWVPVRDILQEKITNAEKLFSSGGTGGLPPAGTPTTRTVYGTISVQDVNSALNLP